MGCSPTLVRTFFLKGIATVKTKTLLGFFLPLPPGAVQPNGTGWQPTELQPLPATSVRGGKAARTTLVPYGCTKFRVSLFPVAETGN